MVASARIQTLTNKSEEMMILMEFIKNPNLISELEQEVKKLNKLTEEEETRLHEAKILLQQKDTIAREIENKKSEMAVAVMEHDKAIMASQDLHDKKCAAERALISAEIASLEERKKLADEKEVELRQKENQLKEKASIMRGLVGE